MDDTAGAGVGTLGAADLASTADPGHLAEVLKVILQERLSERIVEQIVAVPQVPEDAVRVFKVKPQECVSERRGELIVAVEHITLPERWKRAGGQFLF